MKGSVIVILLFIASTCMAQGSRGCRGKEEWPELVGVYGEIAVQIIQWQNPLVKAEIVKEGDSVLAIFDCKHVWVWVSRTNGTVIRTPIIG